MVKKIEEMIFLLTVITPGQIDFAWRFLFYLND